MYYYVVLLLCFVAFGLTIAGVVISIRAPNFDAAIAGYAMLVASLLFCILAFVAYMLKVKPNTRGVDDDATSVALP